MKEKDIRIVRKTKETDITLTLTFERAEKPVVSTSVPFFDHLLHAMAFHGGFSMTLEARGDVDADPHHLVEDTGIVLGQALKQWADARGPVERFAHAVIPMDDALAEVTLDVSGRAYLVYRADYPQQYCGAFDTALVKEFLLGMVRGGGITLHADLRYGDNSHHMAESLFKALGKALGTAYRPTGEGGVRSTKGLLD